MYYMSNNKKRKVDEAWKSVSDSMKKSPSDDYHIEIDWLKRNMCRITTKLYGDHNQPIPACHQSAHYIYLGISIFKMLRKNPRYTSKSLASQKRIFEKLMMDAIYENERYLFLLGDNNFQKSHRWLYICPEELTLDIRDNGNYLLLCVTSENGRNIENCLIQKTRGWMQEGGFLSEINAGHYGFISLHNGLVDMTSSWVTVSSAESARHVEYDILISREINSHITTLAIFQEYAQIIAMPLKERNKLPEKKVKDAYDFIGAISRYDPLLKSYVTRALLKRDSRVFAEYMNPLMIVLIKIENLPIGFKNQTGEHYTLEDRLTSSTSPSSVDDESDFPVQRHRSPELGGKNKKTKKSYRN